jgi:CheY-like chemotaxis protein
VLVIDDDLDTRVFLESFLTSKGADVVTSDFPPNVALLTRHVQPDVVLLDLLSRRDHLAGLDVLGRLYGSTEAPSPPPVLLMSSGHVWLSALKERAQELGIGLVHKPFDLDHLWQMIEQTAHPSSPGAVPIPLRRPGGGEEQPAP